MTKITRIGIDLGKSTFHVYAVDRSEQVVVEKKFTRRCWSVSWRSRHRAWWGSKPVAEHIIGRECFGRWGTMRG